MENVETYEYGHDSEPDLKREVTIFNKFTD
jgi:hypothetical protein